MEPCWRREESVDLDRHDYHQAGVLAMITINRDRNRTLLLMASAVKDADAGDLDKAQAGRRNTDDICQQQTKQVYELNLRQPAKLRAI